MPPEIESTQSQEEQPLPRTIRRHITVQSLFEVAGSVGAPVVWVYYKFQMEHGIGLSVGEGAVFFGLFIAGCLIPRAVFRHLLGAACPAPGCAGKAFPTGRDPIIYVRKSCGRSYPTGMSEGDDGSSCPLPHP